MKAAGAARIHVDPAQLVSVGSKRDGWEEVVWKAAQRPAIHSHGRCADTTITKLHAPPAVPGWTWTRSIALREVAPTLGALTADQGDA